MSRKNTKRQKARRRDNIVAVFLVGFVIICMALVINVRVSNISKKVAIYSQREDFLRDKLKEQKDRKAELDAREIYIKTDEYKIQVAKEKLGLVFPDEILIKPNE